MSGTLARFVLKAIGSEDRRLVFAWANVAETSDGEPVVQEGIDGHSDVIPPEILEKAAHEFMVQSRDGGLMHEVGGVATVVESLVLTEEKLAALGLAKGALPLGWLVTLRVHDDDTWAAVKAGKLPMLSIQGRAEREPEGAAA